jgi:hypothetical protein
MAGVPLLSDQQVRFFGTFGYLKIPGLFAEDIGAITAAFEAVFADPSIYRLQSGDVKVHGFQARTTIPWFIDQHPTLAALRDDPRTVGVVRSLLSDEYEYSESDGNLFSCETEWHCDIYGSPLRIPHIKLSFYLDRLTAETGAPRVMPGTHHWAEDYAVGLRDKFDNNVGSLGGVFGVDGPSLPCVALETEPGDLLAWYYRTIHASYHGGPNRRLFTVNFRCPVPDRVPDRPAERAGAPS